MYRRRRTRRDKMAFGFDSFLDVVANVIGVIIRLILVAWVGGRAYNAAMQWKEADSEATPCAVAEARVAAKSHPLEERVDAARRDLDEARKRLAAHLVQLEAARSKTDAARRDLDVVKHEHLRLMSRPKTSAVPAKAPPDLAAFSAEELKARSRELLAQIEALEKAPLPKKLLRYRTPVSRAVEGDELMFECRGGRVCYVDMPAFLHEIRTTVDDAKFHDIAKLKTWSSMTATVGSFRARYTFKVQESLFSAPGSVRIQMTELVVEPMAPLRGENAADALKPGSDFRRIADAIDPNQTTVTFWVYPDSFALFRALRDYLYEGGIEVAGRPIPFEQPIGASIHGTRSRGQ